MDKLRIAGIVEDSITDGPGLRTTIFLQGCDKRCKGCHNVLSQDLNGGELYSIEKIFEIIKENPILDGVTFSGGEPLLQAKVLIPLLEKIKNELHLDIAIFTGFTFEELLQLNDEYILKALSYANTLVDGPFIIEKRNWKNKFKGSDNQRIIDLQKSLNANSPILNKEDKWN